MRLPDWENRLSDYLGRHRKALFEYGVIDCGLFAGGAIEAATGVDPTLPFRDRYSSRLGSLRALHHNGYANLTEVMDAMFGTVSPAFAQRGDIVMVDGSLGVCVGAAAMFVGQEEGDVGLVAQPMRTWETVWHIPFPGEDIERD